MQAAIPARADLEAGIAAFDGRDYATALKELKPLAEAGDRRAQFILGLMYEGGLGVSVSDSRAWGWFRLAADRGEPDAQLRVAEMHAQGIGVPLNMKAALDWYKKAAKSGSALAKTRIGQAYLRGRGVKVNVLEAKRWLKEAAAAGEPEAEAALAALMPQTAQDDMGAMSAKAQSKKPPIQEDEKTKRTRRALSRMLDHLSSSGGIVVFSRNGIEIEPNGDNYRVRVNGVALELNGGRRADFGALRLDAKWENDDRLQVRVQLPARAAVRDPRLGKIASLSLRSQDVSLAWSESLGMLVSQDIRAQALKFQSPGNPRVAMSLDHLDGTMRLTKADGGRHDLKESWNARGLRAAVEDMGAAKAGRAETSFTVASLQGGGTYHGLDIAAYKALLQGLEGAKTPDEVIDKVMSKLDPKALLALARAADGDFAMEKLRGLLPGGEKIGFENLKLSGGWSTETEGLHRFHLAFAANGLDLPEAAGPVGKRPTRMGVRLVFEKVPATELLTNLMGVLRTQVETDLASRPGRKSPSDASRAAEDAKRKSQESLVRAGAAMQIEEVSLGAEEYDVTITGQLKAVTGTLGIAGTARIMVRGLASLSAVAQDGGKDKALGAGNLAMLGGFKEFAVPGKDAQGRDVDVFDLMLKPDGGITINGRDPLPSAGAAGEKPTPLKPAPEQKNEKNPA